MIAKQGGVSGLSEADLAKSRNRFTGDIMLGKKLKAGDTLTYKGKEITVTGKTYDYRDDDNLNSIQQAHIRGEINLYKPIEAYSQNFDTVYVDGVFVKAIPLGDPRRNDLAPIYMQWKRDYAKRFKQTA